MKRLLFFVCLFVFTSCVPGLSLTGMPVPPYGERWKIQFKDQTGTVVSEATYARGNQSLNVDEFEIKPNSGVVKLTGMY